MSDTPATTNLSPELPEEAVALNAQDEALLATVGAALKTERQEIQVQSAEFKARLLAKVNSGASRRISGRTSRVIRPTSWTYHLKYYAVAVLFIGITLTLFAMSGLLGTPGTPKDPTADIRTARISAEKIALTMDSNQTAASDLFKPYDKQKMKLVIDTQDGEACLALIPQAAIDRDYTELQKKALMSHPNWDVTVDAGRVSLPPQAYSQALGSAGTRVFLLKVAGHYEIWTAEALQRYIERNQKQPGISGELPSGMTVEQPHG
ncbi:MAG TPA: hypothetical protein VL860_04025 [Planctomycetota bacterium]|nr:hypothetical protein [Planctomycetota bacterium]